MADLGKDRRPIVTGWMSWLKDPAFMLLLAGVFFVDQVTKAWVRHSLFLGESVPQEGPLRITHPPTAARPSACSPTRPYSSCWVPLWASESCCWSSASTSLQAFPFAWPWACR